LGYGLYHYGPDGRAEIATIWGRIDINSASDFKFFSSNIGNRNISEIALVIMDGLFEVEEPKSLCYEHQITSN